MEDYNLVIRRCKRSNDTNLNLQGRGLLSIPQDIYNLTFLQTLNLSGNKITAIDPKISQLKELRVLDLSGNSLLELPSEIAKLPSLEQLVLHNNPLQKQYEELLTVQQQMLRETLLKCFKDAGQFTLSQDTQSQDQKKEEQKKSLVAPKNQSLIKSSSQKYGSGILEVDASEFEIREIVSQGGFSIVHRAVLRGTEVALKKIFNPNITAELMQEIDNEIEMLSTLRHPNIVLLMAVTTKPPNLYIATEYVSKGSLYDLLHRTKTPLNEGFKLKVSIQLCRVLYYLHQSGVVHRDIKSHNVLLDDNFKVKICDFGLARKIVTNKHQIYVQQSDLNQGSMQFSGTPAYMAPELFQKKAYDKGVDLFAFGTILWEIYAREVPFEGIDPQDIGSKVIKGEQLANKNIPRSIWQLISDLRQVDSSKRPSLEVILNALEKISI